MSLLKFQNNVELPLLVVVLMTISKSVGELFEKQPSAFYFEMVISICTQKIIEIGREYLGWFPRKLKTQTDTDMEILLSKSV